MVWMILVKNTSSRDLLNEVLIKEYCPFVSVISKISVVRLLIRLEYYMEKGHIVSTSNYKTFFDLLLDAKEIGDGELELGEKAEKCLTTLIIGV